MAVNSDDYITELFKRSSFIISQMKNQKRDLVKMINHYKHKAYLTFVQIHDNNLCLENVLYNAEDEGGVSNTVDSQKVVQSEMSV